MFNKAKKVIALALVCAIAMCNLISCDLLSSEECDHEYGEWEVTKEPTCTQKGEQTKECEKCGDTKTKSVSKLDHDFENGTCKLCGVKDGEVERPSGDITIPTLPINPGYPTEPPVEHPTQEPPVDYPTQEPPVEYPTEDPNGEITFTEIYEGSTAMVNSSSSNEYTYFRFVPSESGYYVFYSYDPANTNTSGDTVGALFDSNMNQFAYDDDSGSDYHFQIRAYLEAGQAYYLRTSSYHSSNITYMVCVEYEENMEPEYVDIYANSSATVEITSGYEVKRFRFEPTENGPYTFYGVSYDYIDSYGRLLDEYGNEIEAADSGAQDGHFHITEYLYAGQTYYFEASLWGSSTGSYELHLDGFPDLTVDDSRRSYADSIGEYFRFIPEESGRYLFYAYNNYGYGTYIDNYAVLFDSNLNYLTENDNGAGDRNFSISYDLEAGQTYYLWVNDSSDYEAYYYVTVELASVEPEFSLISAGTNASVSASANERYTYFKFVPEVSGDYVFYSYGNECNGGYIDVYGGLFDADMNRIDYDDDGSDNRNFYISYYFEAGRTYYFGAANYLTYTYDTYYTVRLEAFPTKEGAAYIYVGDTLSANIDYPYDQQWFKFVPTDNGLYTFYGHGTDDLDSYGYLTDSYGNVISEADGGGEDGHFSISYYLTAGEMYYWVAKMWSSNVGSYEVTLLGFDSIYENESVRALSDNKKTYFKFKPNESGNYIFYSFDNEHNGTYIDSYVYIYDSNGYYITDGDYGGSNGNFEINCYLEGGQEYYICVGEHSEYSEPAYYSVCVEYDRVSNIEYSNIYADNYFCGVSAEVSNTYTYFQFTPDYSGTYVFYSAENYCDYYYVDVYATLFDSKLYELISDDEGGEAFNFRLSYYLEAGETYYFGAASHTSEDIYFSVALYIEEIGYDSELFVSSPVYVSIDEEYDFDLLRFVPEVSGEYLFYSQCDNYIDTTATLLDANAYSLEYSDDGYGSGQFGIWYYLEAGQVYYLQARAYSANTGEFYVICELIG